jgi:hexosaminidase
MILIGKIRPLFTVIFLIILTSCSSSKKNNFNISIIPKPSKMILEDKLFKCSQFIYKKNSGINNILNLLDSSIQHYYRSEKSFFSSGAIPNLFIEIKKDSLVDKNYYHLKVESKSITLTGDSKGVFYGLQSLRQLIYLNNKTIDENIKIPCVEITDSNFFSHRGMLLDCCRHFFSVKTIKKYIDLLAFYKMNVLHWHLTEDQGWRVEIDQYPKLNSIGSYRLDSTGKYGGYYSKKDIREIINYAEERYIEVIPEIELPGHSSAAIASYPNLSCKQAPINVTTSWGVFKDIYCAGNDSVFIFLENVLNEIVELFPSDRIHIGGDEAPKIRWKECPRCQKRMSENNLTNESELQSYFIERVAKILKNKNKKTIGWDEILESEIEGDVTIQSWRGLSGGIQAVKEGKKAIMSPTSHCYFDYNINSIDLEKVYNFKLLDDDLNSQEKKLVIGGECNLWSERIPNEKKLDQQAFPRLLAMSEVLWSSENKNYLQFQERVEEHYNILNRLNVKYGIEAIPVNIEVKADVESVYAKVSSKIKNLKFFYHLNDTLIDEIKQNDSIHITKNEVLSVQAFKNNIRYGNEAIQKIAVHKGLTNSINYRYPYHLTYQASGKKSLVDGKLGGLDFKDGNWQGFYGTNLDVSISLDTVTQVNNVSLNFYQYINSWIVFPKKIKLLTSNDLIKWNEVEIINDFDEIKKRGKLIKSASFKNLNLNSKHLRLVAENFKRLPNWHEAAGSNSWLFTDEIVIE